jgi:hypothetical protein
MKSKKAPAVVRLTNTEAPVLNEYTITNLTEADIRALSAGRVPDWLVRVADSCVAWMLGPAEGMAHDRKVKAESHEAA